MALLANDIENQRFKSFSFVTVVAVERVADVPQEFASLPLNIQQDRTDFLDIDLAQNFSFLFCGLFYTVS